ncbi:hypothetical protein EON67_01350 [archaeon]|nr:MAG: hypothetical protein EON67_01350 [archaeon]
MQLVTWDYQKRLAAGRAEAFEFMGTALSKLTNFPAGNYAACELANVTLCPPLDKSSSHVRAARVLPTRVRA